MCQKAKCSLKQSWGGKGSPQKCWRKVRNKKVRICFFLYKLLLLKSWEVNLLFGKCRTAMILQFFKVVIYVAKKKKKGSNFYMLASCCMEVGQNIHKHQRRKLIHILPRFQSSKQSALWTSYYFLVWMLLFVLFGNWGMFTFLTFKWEIFATGIVGKCFNRLAGFISC